MHKSVIRNVHAFGCAGHTELSSRQARTDLPLPFTLSSGGTFPALFYVFPEQIAISSAEFSVKVSPSIRMLAQGPDSLLVISGTILPAVSAREPLPEPVGLTLTAVWASPWFPSSASGVPVTPAFPWVLGRPSFWWSHFCRRRQRRRREGLFESALTSRCLSSTLSPCLPSSQTVILYLCFIGTSHLTWGTC